MNYRHAYHAGNFADAFKHILLTGLVQSFLRKENAFCYLETHAGTGCYDLQSEAAQKSKEYLNGVAKLMTAANPPQLIQDYIACISRLNPQNDFHLYPGSPFFAKCFLRPQDRMVLSELHPEDVQQLKNFFRRDKQIHVHHQDGYQSLKALLPPKERRGLILIDPPYEKSDELNRLPQILAEALKRFETGVFAVWYPIKSSAKLEPFYRDIKKLIQRPLLKTEFCIYAADVATQFNGCGMLMINPPWQFDQELKTVLPWLWEVLSVNGQGYFKIDPL